ncbi:para-aminobenzoate synthase component I [Bacteroidales bacterium KA00251]|nr:para-aminobenzoate synthase component I [Bacteroidales bacterium KA00251]
MQKMIKAEQAFQAMNRLGKARVPFLFAFNFDLTQAFIVEHPEKQQKILYKTPLGTNCPIQEQVLRSKTPKLTISPITYENYLNCFEVIRKGQLDGDTFLANLTVKTPIKTHLSLEEIYAYSQAKYKLLVPGNFVSFSPESFVKIDLPSSRIETRPMKGTINADLPQAEEKILNDPKEKAEHYTIVDLMRSDLARIATHIAVERFRYIDKLTTNKGGLLQVSSLITGQLPKESASQLGDIFRHLLPAGSISGAPKPATIRLIHKAEKESRGFYSGVFGIFDGKIVDSGVLIRFIAQKGSQMYYHSGGGITIHSDPQSEYREVLEKIYIPT